MSTDVLQRPTKQQQSLTDEQVDHLLAEHASQVAATTPEQHKENLKGADIGDQEAFDTFAHPDAMLPQPKVTPTEQEIGEAAASAAVKVDNVA